MITMLRRFWSWLTSRDKICDDWGCPDCGERRPDWLAWIDDGAAIECASCGTVYAL